MSRCGISESIAMHCDEHESFCPECDGNMYYSDTEHHVLICVECKHEIDTKDGYDEF